MLGTNIFDPKILEPKQFWGQKILGTKNIAQKNSVSFNIWFNIGISIGLNIGFIIGFINLVHIVG